MKITGAALAVYALEQLPIRYTFGIPGVHNTELYDELANSRKIRPILVTHEAGASFIADGISRTSGDIGTLVIVPAAGMTNALSGIGEAFLDGVPMLIISGGVRTDTGKSFQLHDIDQQAVLAAITKKTYRITSHDEIVPTILGAYHIAVSGKPGPVFIEIPADIQLFPGDGGSYKSHRVQPSARSGFSDEKISEAVQLLRAARHPGIFAGWGARYSTDLLIRLAESLSAPVATTLQGLSVFPGDHQLFVGMGFSRAAVPAAENAFKNCDCLLAVGVRFAEIPTGSFGAKVPENLIHIDIDPAVLGRNYPARVAIEGDAREVLEKISQEFAKLKPITSRRNVAGRIEKDRKAYSKEWEELKTTRVNPARFFHELRAQLTTPAVIAVDDGNHTYLTAELFTSLKSDIVITPTDFNCMGYAVPAAIGAKLANPDKHVVGIVGDGSFMMTCMEIVTAVREKLGIVYFVFNDGELSQISQSQKITYNRKTCTVLEKLDWEGLASTVGAEYLKIATDKDLKSVIENALDLSAGGMPVIVDVEVDYSKRTRFTMGVVKTVARKFSTSAKLHFAKRIVKRKITG